MDGSAFAWAGQTMGGDNHVVALLKESAGTWKLNAWIEAPNAPINYIADLYLKNVRSGFADRSINRGRTAINAGCVGTNIGVEPMSIPENRSLIAVRPLLIY